MSRKRFWLGLGVMILVQMIAGRLAPSIGAGSVADAAMQSVLVFFPGALAGGIVARHGFVLPALGLWLVLWAYVIYNLYQIAAPVVQAPLPSIIQYNWAAVLLTGASTGIGAYLGQRLAGSGKGRVAAT